MNNELDFRGAWAPPSAQAVDLDFGARSAEPPDVASAAIRIALRPPAVRLQAAYDNLVNRRLAAELEAGWRHSVRQAGMAWGGWRETVHGRGMTAAGWRHGLPRGERIALPSHQNVALRGVGDASWQRTGPLGTEVVSPFESLRPAHEDLALPWGEASAAGWILGSHFVWLVPSARHHRLLWRQGMPQLMRREFGFSPGRWTTDRWTLPWQRGRRPLAGESLRPGVPPVDPPAPKHHPNLDFICRVSQQGLAWRPLLSLAFGAHPCPGGGFSVPVLQVYVVSNSVDVVRLPGREPLPVKSLRIGIDADSWAWGFSATLPYAALELIEPTVAGPVEIEIAINGVTWVMLVEGFDVRREFGQSSLTVRGRSLAAYLAEPYAPKRSFAPDVPFTARQLAEQELTRADLATGFELDWRLPDWLVPAGAWSYQGLSPIGVIARIADAVGGYLNAHPRLRRLVAKPRYPDAPWRWTARAPDRALPLDVVKTLNLRWQEKPAFNAVFVAGERAGVVSRVVRGGTAGDLPAPMVVDGLVTHADAARERGRAVLSDTGKQALVTLELPMFASVGLLDPGLLVAVGDGGSAWRGLVRSTSIAADWSEALIVRQTVEIERHYL